MLDFTGGYSSAVSVVLVSGRYIVGQMIHSYRFFEHRIVLHQCIKAASQSYYPDIRLGMDGSFRH